MIHRYNRYIICTQTGKITDIIFIQSYRKVLYEFLRIRIQYAHMCKQYSECGDRGRGGGRGERGGSSIRIIIVQRTSSC